MTDIQHRPAIRKIVIEPMTPREPLQPITAPLDDEVVEPRNKAWRALGIMVIALVVGAVLDSGALNRSAHGRSYGTARDVEKAITQPLDDTAKTLQLDEPRKLADKALGRSDDQGTGPGLDTVVKPSPLPSVAPPAVVTPPVVAHRPITPAAPLKVWITGDSDVQYLGTTLVDKAASSHDLQAAGDIDTHIGTGLVRPDVFDWLRYARAEAPKRNADAVVVTLGGNDAQGINTGPGTAVQPGDQAWKALYAQRVLAVAAELSLHGQRPVYWVTLPPARDAKINHAFFEIDAALRYAATQMPSLHLVDAVPILSDHGRYSAYLTDSSGTKVQVRQGDGIHATFTGSGWLATQVLAELRREWKF